MARQVNVSEMSIRTNVFSHVKRVGWDGGTEGHGFWAKTDQSLKIQVTLGLISNGGSKANFSSALSDCSHTVLTGCQLYIYHVIFSVYSRVTWMVYIITFGGF